MDLLHLADCIIAGGWNDLNIPMMSLNSHLVCPENLNWYSNVSAESLTNETGAVFPGRYFTEDGIEDFWAPFPTKGWERLVRDRISTRRVPCHIIFHHGRTSFNLSNPANYEIPV